MAFAQPDITISALTGGVSASPLPGGATDRAILGIQFDKAVGGANAVEGLIVQLTEDPNGRFLNPRLVRSDNGNSFDAADLGNVVGTAAFNTAPNSIEFTGTLTTFGGNSGAETRYLFVVVDIEPSVSVATAPIRPSVAPADVTPDNDNVTGATIMGTNYSFVDTTDPTITFNPAAGATNVSITGNLIITFDEPVRKLDDSPITPADLLTLVELKLNSDGGTDVAFTASIDGTNTIITIDPDPSDLVNNQLYYLEINPVEDGSDNATTASNITFRTPDTVPPAIQSSVPATGASGVSETAGITITLTELIRRADDVNLSSGNIGAQLTLRETNSTGATVTFTPTINAGDNIVTIDPTPTLKSNQLYYVAITGVEDANNNTIAPDPAFITFTTGDSQPPVPAFNPTDGSNGHSVSGNLTITFNEPIRKIDDSPVTPADLLSLVELKQTNDGGTPVPFAASIDGTNTIITIDPSSNLAGGQLYYLEINPVEDALDHASAAINIDFTTELPPSFDPTTPFTPTTTCVGDNIIITGNHFGVIPGDLPTVTINGVTTTAQPGFTNTSLTFTTIAGMEGTGLTVTVTNTTNGLSSTSVSTVTIKPAINTGLSLGTNPASPVSGQAYSILVGGATQTTVSYSVREGLGAFGSTTTGTGSQLPLGSYNHSPGDYYYTIRATSMGCTTWYFPPATTTNPTNPTGGFQVAIANLTANAGTDKDVCAGQGVVIGGSPSATGGTGFHSYSWSPTTGLDCATCANPIASPAGNTTYTLTVNDGSNPTSTDDVLVTVKPLPAAKFISTDSIKTGFSDQDSVYLLSNKVKVSPAGGTPVFTGLGVSKHADNLYYFDPKVVGTQVNMPITFTYTAPNGCSKSATLLVNVFPADAVIGLSEAYCSNVAQSGTLTHNPTYIPANNASFTYSFSRLGFYDCYNGFMAAGDARNPLSLDTGTPALNDYRLNIQKIVAENYPSNCYYIIVWVNQHNIAANTNTEFYTGYKYFQISNIGKPPVITSIGDGEAICYDGAPIKLVTNVPAYTTNNYTINDGTDNSIVTSGPDFFFDPTEITSFPPGEDGKDLTITYSYNDDNVQPAGGCPNTVTRDFFVVKQVEAPTAPDQQYCQFYQDRRILTVTSAVGSTDFHWYDGSTEVGQGSVFDTQISTANPTNKVYTVKQALFGCQGLADNATVIISPAPSSNLTIPPQCEDRVAVLEGPTTNVVSWDWDLGDGTTADTDTVHHVYDNPGVYSLKLVVTSNTGGQICSVTINQSVTVGQNPKPVFTHRYLCDGDVTQFVGNADIPVKDYEWNFGDLDILTRGDGTANVVAPNDNSGRTTGKYKTPGHEYTNAGTYQVYLKTFTNLGCFDSVRRTVTILPYLTTFNSTTPYEMAEINGGNGFWSIEDLKDSTTWAFAPPAKTIITSASSAWVTNPVGNYKANDASVVNSPCLNISGFVKPVLSMDFIANTDEKSDGAVLEYSIDGGVTWNALGAPGSGQNWFNTVGFNSGKIGDSQVGWSGDIMGESNTWLEGKRALDNIIPLGSRNKVRFRIAFGSNVDTEFEGFAFNNVTITERNRISLIEHFTNIEAPNYDANNTAFTDELANETVKLQYHLSFPGEDPINSVNEADPAARAAYYGITNTGSIIPRVYIDGESEGSFATNWYVNFFALRSLKTAPFDISITTSPSTNNSELIVQATATSRVDMIEGPVYVKPILHVAVIEKTVGDNVFVLRKMLPDAAGTEITLPKLKDDISTAGPYIWQVNDESVDPSNLALIAFVQDEMTKEVYQAQVVLAPVDLPTTITGVEPGLADLIRIYPTPANQNITITLPAPAKDKITVTLIDTYGKEIATRRIEKGVDNVVITTSEFSSGVYVIKLDTPDGKILRRKVIVQH